ncbi:hypothetical protein SAMN05216348_105184 [Olsenella sp. KH3B4]|nr:hypothetical protein SAMN05216348_105184 [Olsenella sp. KH3B4]
MAKNDARDDGTWYQLGFPEPEREEYLALHAERPTEVGPSDSRALLEGFDFLVLVSHSFFPYRRAPGRRDLEAERGGGRDCPKCRSRGRPAPDP